MGTNNRDRRRQKKRRQAAAARARERRRQAPWVESTLRSVIDADDIECMLAAAVCAHRDRDVDVVLDLVETLAYGAIDHGGPGLVDAVVARCVRRDATAGLGAADGVSGRRVVVDDPYAKEKSLLLGKVASANRCRAVWSPDLGWSTVFGADDDFDIVELLFTSLLCQATSAMAVAGSTDERGGGRHARTRSFRQSFLCAYAIRIGERLRQANHDAAEAAVDADESGCLLPVLAARQAAAEAAVREAFPHLGRSRFSAHDYDGWAAGTAAADVASLDSRRAVEDTAG